ncbi:MAG: DUF4933 domain-containing protein [Bacteroidales bacterium]|nr:DUF4933 domain-containing protein [Bacteroidales bacterium]
MKNILKTTFLILLLFGFACHRNKLKTDERVLSDKMKKEERLRAIDDSTKRAGRMNSRVSGISGGFKRSEDRSVDPSSPPVRIDIAGNLENFADLKLSDIGTSIEYVRMAPIPDTTIPSDLKFRYNIMDNFIVANNLYGIHLYAKDGRYIRQIVKNEMTGVEVTSEQLKFWFDYTLKGGRSVTRVDGNKLFYNYSSNITGQNYIMEYDCSSTQLTPDYKFDPENPDRISGLGNVSIDLNHGNTVPPPPRKHQGMFSGNPEAFYYDPAVQLLDADTYIYPVHDDKNMLVVINYQGDTLSEFTRREKLVNYTKSLMRGTDGGSQYEENGYLYVRPAFNDTVFRITPPNRMTPVYILNLGSYKVTKKQGVDPDFKLTDKIIPSDWAETRKHIFMTFTKDDYDCPNTRKNKTVKIYYAIFYKESGILKVIKGDPFNYAPEILDNNIDGGVPVWPAFYSISKNGEILVSLKGKDIKRRIKSKEYRQSSAPEHKKMELEKLAASVSESEDILMIIK